MKKGNFYDSMSFERKKMINKKYIIEKYPKENIDVSKMDNMNDFDKLLFVCVNTPPTIYPSKKKIK